MTAMTAEERLAKIQELQESSERLRASIEERKRRRLEDPFSEHERMLADARFTKDETDLVFTEPAGSPPMQRGDREGVLYRTYDPNERAPAAADDGPSDDEAYPPLSELHEAIAEFVVTWTERKLAPCHERIAKLEAQVEMLTALLGQKRKLWTPSDGA